MIDSLRQDLSFAARSLRRSRVYTITVVLTLALGIASATLVFSLLDGVLIRPLPFADAGRLMTVVQAGGTHYSGVSYPNYKDIEASLRQSASFAGFGYARGRGTSIAGDGAKTPEIVALVSPGFLGTLREKPLLGRLFTADEEQSGAHVMVISWDCWQQQFHGDAGVIGRAVALEPDGVFTVVGVMPRGPLYPTFGTALYLPLNATLATESALNERALTADSRMIVRLAPGVTAARATTEMSAITKRLAATYPEDVAWPAVQITPLRDEVLGNAGIQLAVLAIAVGLVLLITWVNVANLSLVRAATRTRELAIRVGLGASGGRIATQLLVESLVLAVAAGGLAVVAVIWSMSAVKAIAANLLPRVDLIHVDGRALLVCALLALLSTVAIGIVPALNARSPTLTDALREDAAGSGASVRQRQLRSLLVSGELAFALALVISAGLLIKSFWRLSEVDAGFNTHHLVAVDFSPPPGQNNDAAQAAAFYTRMLAAVHAVPGVTDAALSNHMPLSGAALPVTVQIAGRPVDAERDPPVLFRTISTDYLHTMQIPLKRGRGFAEADMTSGTGVLVNEAFVRAFWPSEDPLGRSVLLHKAAQGRPDAGEPLPSTVVGVIGDVHHFGINSPPVPEIYIPYTRNPWGHMALVARSAGEPAALIPAVRRAMLTIDPALPANGGATNGIAIVDNMRDGSLASSRFNMALLGGFGACALLLAALGIYGMMAFVVAQRHRELGIRRALGAQVSDVTRLVLGAAARLIAVGVVAGLLGAYALTRLLTGLLYGVAPTDAATFVVMTAVLALVAFGACAVPAWHASRVDPAEALRK